MQDSHERILTIDWGDETQVSVKKPDLDYIPTRDGISSCRNTPCDLSAYDTENMEEVSQ